METRVSRYSSGRRFVPEPSHRGRRIRWPFITAGAVLCAFTIINMIVGNSNLGTYLPALLGLPLLVYGIWRPQADRWFSHGAGRVVKWILIAAYIAVAAVVIVSSIAIGMAISKEPPAGADAIVVLGAAVHGDEVTDTLEKRLDTAMKYYWDNPGSVIVVTGGMGSGESLSEAEAMRRYLVAYGVPGESIIVEDKASNTRENFVFSRNLIEERLGEPAQIVYVTSDFHILRAGAEAHKAGFENAAGLGAPTPIFTVPGAWLRESGALVRGLLRGDFSTQEPAAEAS